MDNELYFITPNRNDQFSLLKGLDLQELIFQIDNFYLTYRSQLNLPYHVTFGVEIEYEGIKKSRVDEYISNNFADWKSKKDGSLILGGEITSPILQDEIDNWKELQQICKYLRRKQAIMHRNAGGHIHVGAHILGGNFKKCRKFIKLYTVYESVLFRFFYGDNISGRKKMQKYARPIADELFSNIKVINNATDIIDIKFSLPTDKYQAINFKNVDFGRYSYSKENNTIEFRVPNATNNEIVLQNNINTATKLMLSPTNREIDEELLDYKLEKERISSTFDFYMYNEINLKNVLEFVDSVFDNNLDKVYFLRQYIKNFQGNFGLKKAVKAKKFTK